MQKYHFLYDSFGNTTSIGIGGWNSTEKITLASYEYAAMNGLLTRQTYGNRDYVEFTYDILGRAKTTTYYDENENVDRVLTYVYTGDGQLYSIEDSKTGYLYQYTYDSIGRLIASSVKHGDTVLMQTRQDYDANNQMTAQHWTVGGTTYSQTFSYNKTEGSLSSMTPGNGDTITLTYDALRRLSSVTGGVYERKYLYRDIGTDKTTSQVSSLTYKNPAGAAIYSYSYTYDVLGNIASYTDASGTQVYEYDAQSQLKKVKNTSGNVLYQYTYDNAGNILTANGKTYTYGNAVWKDLLTKYDGQSIAYEGQTISGNTVTGTIKSGNPISYYNGTRWEFDWEEGRNLVKAESGSQKVEYTYDLDGLRTSKKVGNVTHNYYYASGKLLRETYGGNTLDFFYDNSGYPYALKYNGILYYYITNLQGDVLHLTNTSGTVVVSYTYDPYGKPLDTTGTMAATLGAGNPLRYRGYYYDSETGLYYVSSRYYDPKIGRFIVADDVSYLGANGDLASLNLFAYCGNNPINREDEGGGFWLSALVGAIVNVATTYIAAKVTNQEYTLRDAAVAAASGAVNAIPVVGPLLSGSITGIYTGVMAYQNGASVGEAIGCGVFAGICTTASIGNLSNATGPALDIATNAAVDLVFGTGYNSMAAATYKAVTTEPTSNTNVSNHVQQVSPHTNSSYQVPSRAVDIQKREIMLY